MLNIFKTQIFIRKKSTWLFFLSRYLRLNFFINFLINMEIIYLLKFDGLKLALLLFFQ